MNSLIIFFIYTDRNLNQIYIFLFNLACPSDKTLKFTSNSHEITSPNYPNNYLNNDFRCYKIFTEQTTRILLYFLDLKTEQCCDFLKVFDGIDENSTSLGSFSGSALSPPLVTTSNKMFITFETDGGSTYKGFRIHYITAKNGKFMINI